MRFIKGIIIKGVGGLYSIKTQDGIFTCSARGLFRLKEITPLIGDRVDILADEGDGTGVISNIEPRKTELIRPRVANVTQAVIVFAVKKPLLNFELIDRFLIMSEQAGVKPLICINKSDLLKSDSGLKETLADYEKAGYRVLMVSAKSGDGLSELRPEFANHISVLAGPSGVGKSSLINALCPGKNLETGGLSAKIDRGKHTTRHAELMELEENSFIVDTPGFTSLNLEIDEQDLALYYPEFRPVVGECFFNNCFHETEPDCAVKAQVGGAIGESRYERYINLLKEIRGNKND